MARNSQTNPAPSARMPAVAKDTAQRNAKSQMSVARKDVGNTNLSADKNTGAPHADQMAAAPADNCPSNMPSASPGKQKDAGGWDIPILTRPANGYNYLGSGNYGYDKKPVNVLDGSARSHDQSYDAHGANGPTSALFNTSVLGADARLANEAFRAVADPSMSWKEKGSAALTGAFFTAVSVWKTAIRAAELAVGAPKDPVPGLGNRPITDPDAKKLAETITNLPFNILGR